MTNEPCATHIHIMICPFLSNWEKETGKKLNMRVFDRFLSIDPWILCL